MNARSLGWFAMTLLAIAVAGYAGTMVFFAAYRPELVRTLVTDRPVFAFAHFACGAIALLAGAMQLNARLRARLPTIHRWLGRLYVTAVALGGSASLVLAFQSQGGAPAHVGFALLAIGWLMTTLIGYRQIRARNMRIHRHWMIRSYALTLAAVTLRIYLPVSQVAGIGFDVAYPVIAWACWIPNLLFAEWFIRSRAESGIPQEIRFGSEPLDRAS